MSDKKLSRSMEAALVKFFEYEDPESAYGSRISLATIQSLCKRGYLTQTNQGQPGNMAFPRTNRTFAITQAGRDYVLKARSETEGAGE